MDSPPQTSELERLVRRMTELEARVTFLEGSKKYMKAIAEKKRQARCRWVPDKNCPDGRFWLPRCMGGAVLGEQGCTCR